LSRPRSLIDCSKAVAMFMCVSSVFFRAVSSGSAVMAVFRLAVFDEKSLFLARNRRTAHICDTSLTSVMPVDRVISAASVLYLLSSESISSATCGKGLPAFLAQKKSFESMSYDFFWRRPFSGD
jgi:hypothetical protein